MVTVVVLAGLGVGTGLALVLGAIAPAPVPLRRALTDHRPARTAAPAETGAPGPVEWVGLSLARSSWATRVTDGLASDLRITGRTAAGHLGSCMVLGTAGALWAPIAAVAVRLGGLNMPLPLILWAAVILAPLGAACPRIALRSEAATRRRAFRHALSSFLDVVSISLAGGCGVDSALQAAGSAGSGWAFVQIRRALLDSRYRGESPWTGLARLGNELAVPELGELAAAVSLAGDEGARVRASLAARARSLRQRGMSEIEAAASSASERMSLPVVGLMVGFVGFVVYPALDRILTSL